MNWPTFFTRLGSAVVFAAVMMCGLLWKDWMFVVLVGVIMVLCLREYFKLTRMLSRREISFPAVIVTYVIGIIWLFLFSRYSDANYWYPGGAASDADKWYEYRQWSSAMQITAWAMLFTVAFYIIVFVRLGGWWTLLSLVYIILPCCLLVMMQQISKYIPLILILCIWMNDTMAYIVGSFIGKTPFSKISPKKTWEGTIGGALLAVVGAAVAAHFIPGQPMPLYIALALCAAIAGTAGDLFESKLKRMAGVKDSGTMMPGHGGALDRFDSLLVATPFAFCAVYLVQAFT